MLVIPTERLTCTAATVLVLVHLRVLLPYDNIYIYKYNIPGTKYDVRGCRCQYFVSWESYEYAERYEYLADSELVVDCRKMTNDLLPSLNSST